MSLLINLNPKLRSLIRLTLCISYRCHIGMKRLISIMEVSKKARILYCSMCILITSYCVVYITCVTIDTECTIMLVLNTYLVMPAFSIIIMMLIHVLQGDSYDARGHYCMEIRN